jgi:hypothetical protein
MKNYEPAMTFGEETAAMMRDQVYGDEEAVVAFLSHWIGAGPALELGIGTGRIALRLAAATGIRVDGIEISRAMIEQLRAKPGGQNINVTIGDFADVPVKDEFRLIYIPANTFFNLLTQEDQVRCFENVASHLTHDGAFVIEAMLPDFLYRLHHHQYVHAEMVAVDEVRLDVLRHDPVKQMIDESHVALSATGVRLNPVVQRYAWPAEMDLMARIAGLQLKERWADWDRHLWTARSGEGRGWSPRIISVYGR